MPGRVETKPMFEGCRIIFRNFSGEQSQFNPMGKRNFCVIIDDMDVARDMKNDGWNVKYLQPREEGDSETPYLQVEVSYLNVPPTIVILTSGGRTVLNEDTVGMLDHAEIENVDLIINPYNWEVNGKSGVKAYVKSMYVTLSEDALAQKYGNVSPVGYTSQDNPPFDYN